ncbi:DUF2865 domain-containing protein [Ancylobacter lacus]|uniref:DUF2865 domain-containing protein n=1 Tax=Ancylobacter lacus TaxID=2579970 RepID=UPI001FE2ED00|nr:DUF2865 domain-containing protein [Ancylobacter lacus]
MPLQILAKLAALIAPPAALRPEDSERGSARFRDETAELMSLTRDLFARARGMVLAVPLLALGISAAAAQAYPDPAANDPQNAARTACLRLEAQLGQLGRGAGGNLEATVAKQRGDVEYLNGQMDYNGCNQQGFLIFQPQLPPQCTQIRSKLAQAQAALDRSMAQLESQRGGLDAQRRQIVQQLAQNDCGPQYRAALGGGQPGQNQQRQPRQPRNFFEQLFGVPADESAQPSEEMPSPDIQPSEMPRVSSYRTVCVRTCDGFFFPISSSTTPASFANDEALCQRQCPGTEARLFAYRTNEDIDHAVGTNGQPYTSLPNAGLYRKQFVSTCSCRPAGMSWGQALAGADTGETLRQGDIVVTEDKARELSQPLPATPAKTTPAPAKTAPAKPTAASPAATNPAATRTAPAARTQPAPQQPAPTYQGQPLLPPAPVQ